MSRRKPIDPIVRDAAIAMMKRGPIPQVVAMRGYAKALRELRRDGLVEQEYEDGELVWRLKPEAAR